MLRLWHGHHARFGRDGAHRNVGNDAPHAATASFRACYAKLSAADADALRREVADPTGCAGLRLESTGYDTWLDLVAACRADGWVLDEPAQERPLFPAVDEKSGNFLFTESFEVHRLCKRVIAGGRGLGMNEHCVGAWSFRKDATEVVAKTGKGEVAARVLGHRHVNSRTMDRVYRADLRCRDLGSYWTGRAESVAGAPLTCLSARRVPMVGGVKSVRDLPADSPERAALDSDSAVQEASEDVARATSAAQAVLAKVAPVGISGSAMRVGQSGWKKMARSLGGVDEVAEYEKVYEARHVARLAAEDRALHSYKVRLYKEGQASLAQNKARMVGNMATHAWAPRSENAAIAYGLDRTDRTRELASLKKLPAAMQGSILQVGALQVLPAKGTPAQVYRHVAEQCEATGCCSLRCKADGCEDEADVHGRSQVKSGIRWSARTARVMR